MVSRQGRALALAILSGLVFGAVASRVSVDQVPLILLFLQSNSAVLAGAFWQLFTSLIIAPPDPLGAIDVLFNALAVVWLDGILSSAYDLRQYFGTFLLSGLAGNVISLLNGPAEISFGASGGIFGLLAGAVSADFAAERRVNYGLLAWFLLIFVFSSFALPLVDWLAHLGGSVFGVVAGYYLGVRRRRVVL